MEDQFHNVMLDVYVRAKEEAGYKASRFLAMLEDRGGFETARYLLRQSNVSDGYTNLYLAGSLDLTVEAVVLRPEWSDLFAREELQAARQRLKDYGYDLPAVD